LRARARGDLVLALTGAPLEARILRDDDEDPSEHEGGSDLQAQPVAMGRPIALHDGEVLHLGIPDRGVRTYLAVRGGFDVAPVLGSCSTDTLSGLGPPPLTGGTELPVADPDRAGAVAMHASPSARTCPGAGETTVLRVLPGPREDWFEQTALDLLTGQEWQVTEQSDRIGLRLTPLEGGTVLTRSRTDELPSEGVVSGALQVPTSGEPVLFLADHPTTGGYPVIAVLHIDDIPLAAQLPPGARTRFTLEAA
ncbi:MAG: biotin-dependent carboxyltransferase family protein, partial [Brachybacterium sp.]|nr:biotin-dependent carboxyltransferase family protein [Brachybacterium sp.]